MNKLSFKKNKLFISVLALVGILFFLLRFWGVGQLYHQDEYRWATIANPVTIDNPSFNPSSSPHPPITEYALKAAGYLFGFNNLRITPIFFSFLNLILLYFINKKLTQNRGVGLISIFLASIGIYSLIASLQIDIDGAILPFFILLGYYAYVHLKEKKSIFFWATIFGIAIIGGFLTKISYLLFIGALLVDYSIELIYLKKINLKKTARILLPYLATLIFTTGFFYYFYATKLQLIVDYASHFRSLNFASRAYFDLLFKIFKSFVWLSPLLALSTVYGLFKKEILSKYRLWFIYLGLNLLFYLVLFDFTTLTVERYFMFLIVPSVLISGSVIYGLFEDFKLRKDILTIILAVAAFIIFSFMILSVHSDVLPLNPKAEYVNYVKALNFNFLIPFSGGSGPAGFYFSAQFILWSWIVSITSFLGILYIKRWRVLFAIIFVVWGLGYNVLFINEYLRGGLYGSPADIAEETIDYVVKNEEIKEIITYYDIGAYELRLANKYSARFYTAPSRDYTERMLVYRGHYMIIDFPGIDRGGRYWKLLERCPIINEFADKKVKSYVFDCQNI